MLWLARNLASPLLRNLARRGALPQRQPRLRHHTENGTTEDNGLLAGVGFPGGGESVAIAAQNRID